MKISCQIVDDSSRIHRGKVIQLREHKHIDCVSHAASLSLSNYLLFIFIMRETLNSTGHCLPYDSQQSSSRWLLHHHRTPACRQLCSTWQWPGFLLPKTGRNSRQKINISFTRRNTTPLISHLDYLAFLVTNAIDLLNHVNCQDDRSFLIQHSVVQ